MGESSKQFRYFFALPTVFLTNLFVSAIVEVISDDPFSAMTSKNQDWLFVYGGFFLLMFVYSILCAAVVTEAASTKLVRAVNDIGIPRDRLKRMSQVDLLKNRMHASESVDNEVRQHVDHLKSYLDT